MTMRRIRRIQVAPTVGTDAYTANDVVGGLMTFSISDQGFDGLVRSILVTDAHSQAEAYVLYLFGAQPSTIADDAAFAPTIADLKKIIGVVTLAAADYTTVNSLDWALLGGHEDNVAANVTMEIPAHSDNGDIYMYAVATDTPDYNAATDLTFTLSVEVF